MDATGDLLAILLVEAVTRIALIRGANGAEMVTTVKGSEKEARWGVGLTGSDFGLQECRKKQRGVGENGVERHPHISTNTERNPNTKYVFEKLSTRSFQRCYSYDDPGRPGSEYVPVEIDSNIKPRVD